jgi:hypothetical protein
MVPDQYDVGFISCSGSKNPTGATAITLYRGSVFGTQMRHAQQRCHEVVIVSAKYGLLRPSDPVRWYDQYLGDLSPDGREALKLRIREQAKGFPVASWVRRLSYLPTAYHTLVLEAIPELADPPLRRPYVIRMHTQIAILSKEIQNYGKQPSRRA